MTREELLDEAKEIVTKHRQSAYGTPEDNFGKIGRAWTDYLAGRKDPRAAIGSHDVAAMMILLKVIRSQNDPGKTDNWLDIAGYAACGVEVATEGPPKAEPDDWLYPRQVSKAP